MRAGDVAHYYVPSTSLSDATIRILTATVEAAALRHSQTAARMSMTQSHPERLGAAISLCEATSPPPRTGIGALR
jgi:hypothetical protein